MNKTLALSCIAAAVFIVMHSCSNDHHRSAKQIVQTGDKTSEPTEDSRNKDVKRESSSVADTSAPHSLSSLAAVEQGKDGMRFVRVAEIKFQVNNVTDATYRIEDVTSQYGGFVTYTDLHSTVSSTETVPVSADSALSITYYTVENDINLRIPNRHLDSALRAMSGLVDFLDHRVISATEVSLQGLANDLAAQRHREYEESMKKYADKTSLKPEDGTIAEDKALQGREAADNARLANLRLGDQVKYSTVHMHIYQHMSLRKIKVANEINIARYRPSFGTQILESLAEGWNIFAEITVALTKLWMLAVISLIAYLVYHFLRKQKTV